METRLLDTTLCQQEDTIKDRSTFLMLSMIGHPAIQQCPGTNGRDSNLWFHRQEEAISLVADSSLLSRADLSSLFDDEDNHHEDHDNHSHLASLDQDEMKPKNMHCLHECLTMESETVSAAATIDTLVGRDELTGEPVSESGCCATALRDQLSINFPSGGRQVLENFSDPAPRIGTELDNSTSASFHPVTHSSLPSFFFALPATPSPPSSNGFFLFAQPQTTTDHILHEKGSDHTQQNKCVSSQPNEEGRHSAKPHAPGLLESAGMNGSFQQILGEPRKVKNKTGCNSRADGMLQLDQDEGCESGGVQIRRPHPRRPPCQQEQEATRQAPNRSTTLPDDENSPWYMRFQELVDYKKKNGHCNVPFCYKQNPFLAAWVKRQRYQYKCKLRGKHSHLTEERHCLLEQLGFVWDSHVAAWDENYARMAEFQKRHGHCCVPMQQKELREWAKRQRRHYKQRRQQAESSAVITSRMSDDRIRRLNQIQFEWEATKSIRRQKKKTSSTSYTVC